MYNKYLNCQNKFTLCEETRNKAHSPQLQLLERCIHSHNIISEAFNCQTLFHAFKQRDFYQTCNNKNSKTWFRINSNTIFLHFGLLITELSYCSFIRVDWNLFSKIFLFTFETNKNPSNLSPISMQQRRRTCKWNKYMQSEMKQLFEVFHALTCKSMSSRC